MKKKRKGNQMITDEEMLKIMKDNLYVNHFVYEGREYSYVCFKNDDVRTIRKVENWLRGKENV